MLTVDSHTDQTPVTDDRFAVALRGFGPVGLLAMVVIVAGNALIAPLSAVLVLVWARMSRRPLRSSRLTHPVDFLWVVKADSTRRSDV